MGGGVGDVEAVEPDDLRERKRQEFRDMSRGWSGLGLLYRLLVEGSWVDCGEMVVVEGEEVTRDKVEEGLELAVGPRRRELAELTLLLLLLGRVLGAVGWAVDLLLGFSWCEQVLDPSLQVEHWLSE